VPPSCTLDLAERGELSDGDGTTAELAAAIGLKPSRVTTSLTAR
jgi:hypothetical protein